MLYTRPLLENPRLGLKINNFIQMYLEIDRKKTKEIGRKLSETQDFLFKTTYQSYKEGE